MRLVGNRWNLPRTSEAGDERVGELDDVAVSGLGDRTLGGQGLGAEGRRVAARVQRRGPRARERRKKDTRRNGGDKEGRQGWGWSLSHKGESGRQAHGIPGGTGDGLRRRMN